VALRNVARPKADLRQLKVLDRLIEAGEESDPKPLFAIRE
jgi:hypothetical protein